MAKTKQKGMSTFAIIFILIVVIAGGCTFGFFAWKTDMFSKPFKLADDTFSITIDGSKIADGQSINQVANVLKVDCATTNADEYNVKIIPYVTKENSFDFTVDGSLYSFAGIKNTKADFADMFDVKKYNSFFTLNTSKKTMISVLNKIYKGEIKIPACTADCYFTLVVVYKDGTSVRINLNGAVGNDTAADNTGAVDGVALDKGEVIF
ncbi:MAG: hypothetical protein RR338_00235 [Clostridia bacterium]